MLNIIEYRDPLFGIIILFFTIFSISFLTYTYTIYKEKRSRKEYRKLIKRFDLGTLKEEDYIHLYKTYNLPFDSILLLASTFIHNGQYNKAINIYLTLLEHVSQAAQKEELLEYLGNTYFKSGMLKRAENIYIQLLKISPRNKTALKHLIFVFQKLKEYTKANEVLDALNELDEDIIKDKIYINLLKTIDDPLLSFEIKSTQLYNNFKINKVLNRLVATYLIKFNKELFWKHCLEFNLYEIIDILWYLEFEDINFTQVEASRFLSELYSAKGYINNAISSDIFELQVLISTKNSKIKVDLDLNFEFFCNRCKKTHPVYESRCPHCYNILTFKVEPKLAKSSINLTSLV